MNTKLRLAIAATAQVAMAPLLWVGLCATLGAADPAPVPPSAPPSLAGTWTLNRDQSEDARAKMRDAMGGERPGSEGRSGGGGRRPGGGGFGGGRGRMGAPPDGGQGAGEPGGPMRSFFEPAPSLTITQTAAEIGVDDGLGVKIIHPDGRKAKGSAGETTAKWSGVELIVESKTGRGATLTTAYMLVPEKRQLHVTSRLEGRGQPVTVRRVYDAAAATEAVPPPS